MNLTLKIGTDTEILDYLKEALPEAHDAIQRILDERLARAEDAEGQAEALQEEVGSLERQVAELEDQVSELEKEIEGLMEDE